MENIIFDRPQNEIESALDKVVEEIYEDDSAVTEIHVIEEYHVDAIYKYVGDKCVEVSKAIPDTYIKIQDISIECDNEEFLQYYPSGFRDIDIVNDLAESQGYVRQDGIAPAEGNEAF